MANFAEPSYIRDVIAGETIKARSLVKFNSARRVETADAVSDRVAGVSLNNFDVAAGQKLEIATGGVAVVPVASSNSREIFNGSLLTAAAEGTAGVAVSGNSVFGFALSYLAGSTDGEVEVRLTLTHESLA